MPESGKIKRGSIFKDPDSRYTLDGNPVATCPLCKKEYHTCCMTNTDDNYYVCEFECWDDFLENYRDTSEKYVGVNRFSTRAMVELNISTKHLTELLTTM